MSDKQIIIGHQLWHIQIHVFRSKISAQRNSVLETTKKDNQTYKILIFKAELITPIRRGIAHMQSYGYANGKLVVEAELMAQISKRK